MCRVLRKPAKGGASQLVMPFYEIAVGRKVRLNPGRHPSLLRFRRGFC